jgi:hypothetical protein
LATGHPRVTFTGRIGTVHDAAFSIRSLLCSAPDTKQILCWDLTRSFHSHPSRVHWTLFYRGDEIRSRESIEAQVERARRRSRPRSSGTAPPEFGEQTMGLTGFAFCKEPDENRLANAHGPFWPVMDPEAQHCAQWMPMASIRAGRADLFQALCSFSMIGELGEKK